ncbi:NADAR family protein [Streptomyces sp. MS1.HAVA.3]|uniref:NADAR family protein n=1 Tax=Streptomyces caledonius TaxID=3134107 RepID=A0ABU8TY58_9ACTN
MSVADPAARTAVAAAESGAKAESRAAAPPRREGREGREGWEQARAAVMARLLRAKYEQHPDLAAILLATGDATVLYDDAESGAWGDKGGRGRNWSGRLRELIRQPGYSVVYARGKHVAWAELPSSNPAGRVTYTVAEWK